MTQRAQAAAAINLAQGFPDFDGPDALIDALERAARGGENQYARSQGHPRLVRALAARYAKTHGQTLDPMTQIGVFSGCTEAIFCALVGLLEPGDEVILFEPFYDSYPVGVACAGAVAKFCTLRAPDFRLDAAEVERLITPRTRVVLLNTPHNPTGRVFSRGELEALAEVCARHDLWLISDEVYEHLTYGVDFVPPSTLPQLRDRTLTLSSAGKTFSMTGWKVGWSMGPAPLVAAAQAAHQYVTFATHTPTQVALAEVLESLDDRFYDTLRAEYRARRDLVVDALRHAGFEPLCPDGAYFVLARFGRHAEAGLDDRALALRLVAEAGVAAIPPSPFYSASDDGRAMLRFAFCKRTTTLTAAAERLQRWSAAQGRAQA
jgi:N-succinyldiaminopimelate aminotransferase